MTGEGGEGISQALAALKDCDCVIVCLGGTSSRFSGGEFNANGALKQQDTVTMDCGENVDDCRLRLPGAQLSLLRQLHELGNPVIALVIGGRPYAMEEIDSLCQSLIYSFYPGLTGGDALARVIFGACAPGGRLPVSLPDQVGQLPVYYNPKDSYQAMTYYNGGGPRYPFGSGIGYTTFAYALLSPQRPLILP